MTVEAIPAATRDDPDELRRWLAGRTLSDVVAHVEGGYLSIEAILGRNGAPVDPDLAQQVSAVCQLNEQNRRAAQALSNLEVGVGVAVCLAGVDDPVKAAKALKLDDADWAVEDGHFFGRGVESSKIEAALAKTR